MKKVVTSERIEAHIAMQKKKNNRMSILTYIIFALVATIIFSGSTLSRYTHTVQGFDEADVIVSTIYLTEDLYSDSSALITQTIDLEGMIPGMTLTKYIKIRSATPNADGTPTKISSTPQNYAIEVSSLGVLPLTFEISAHSMADGSQSGTMTGGSTAVVDGALIQDGDNSNIYKLQITWPESEENNNSDYNGVTDRLTIKVWHESIYDSEVTVDATIDKITSPVAAGEKIKLNVNLSTYANGYAGANLSDIIYDSSRLSSSTDLKKQQNSKARSLCMVTPP